MADYPALPLFTDAYLADCHPALTLEQHGCYLVLLMMAWRRPSNGIPDNDREIARKLAIEPRKWSALKKTVLERFWNLGDGGEWHQKRLDKERAFVDKSRENCAKNAQKRWSKSRGASNENKDLPDATPYAPTPTPTKKEENYTSYNSLCDTHGISGDLFGKEGATNGLGQGLRKTTSRSSSPPAAVPQSKAEPEGETPKVDAGFEAFWKVYPKKVAKGQAMKAYAAAITKATPEQIKAGAEGYAAARVGEPDKYTKHPATWLNSECWADEAAPPQRPPQEPTMRVVNGPRPGSVDDTIMRQLRACERMGY
ncbi:MAG TPA: DUF1376 domain-containing protein [Xanthobacteraceae bacterium]|nr:DUF1376 domain-containing protein [Xanthobacteraceae bacterium]